MWEFDSCAVKEKNEHILELSRNDVARNEELSQFPTSPTNSIGDMQPGKSQTNPIVPEETSQTNSSAVDYDNLIEELENEYNHLSTCIEHHDCNNLTDMSPPTSARCTDNNELKKR